MTLNLNSPPQTHTDFTPRITVIGVGGGGTNAVDNMIAANLRGVDFVVANTDAQQLMHSKADRRVQLGPHITQGLGAGAKPEIGRAAAEEAADELYRHLDGAHMVFITAGMGGGTGTGAAPVIARMAKERGILTVGVVTKPFGFEGSRRARAADEGIAELQQYVDTLIVIPNQNLFNMATERTTWREAFKMADQVLYMGVRGVTDLMMVHGLINLDFADIKTVMAEMGKAMMGTGEAEGEGRATRAAEAAINNQLLEETSMAGARGLLINITGGEDMTLFEVDEAVSKVREQVDDEANVLFGSAVDESLAGRIRVSVVATGIDNPRWQEQPRPKLVAVGGGGGMMAEARPIPVPLSNTVVTAQTTVLASQAGAQMAVAYAAEPVTQPASTQHLASNVTALRHQSAPQSQPQPVIIRDPMPLPGESAMDHLSAGSASGPQKRVFHPETLARPKAGSSLFASATGLTEPARDIAPAQPSGDSIAKTLFQQATGMFRKRQPVTPALAPEPRRREPVNPARQGQGQEAEMEHPPMEMPGERSAERNTERSAERPSDRRAQTADDGLDIPAFLRRQSNPDTRQS